MIRDSCRPDSDRILSLEIECRSLEGRVRALEEIVKELRENQKPIDCVARVIGHTFLTDGKGMD